MLHSTDYQRYKQKLERLQSKVKKSEVARKELEIKFQRLMKERNECEKVATIHKSKYASLLEQERKRMNRNEELLHMLEEVDAKAAALATKTERLKILKTQQEFSLMNSWRRNNYLHQQLIFSNVQTPNDGISSILKCTQPIDYSGTFAKPIIIDPNENVRYGSPINSDFIKFMNPNLQQPPFESNAQHLNEAEKFINNSSNHQQQTLSDRNHSQQYSASSMPFYHCNKDERQFLVQHTHFESPQQFNQYEPALASQSIQQTYGAGYPVPVNNRQNSTTLSMSTLSSYQLPMKIEHNEYYPNLNQQNIINSSLIDVENTNRNESTLSTIPVKEKFMATAAPSFIITKLPSDDTASNKIVQHENTSSRSNVKPSRFDDGNNTYSTIKNVCRSPLMHYQSQQSLFSPVSDMTTTLPMENSQKTIDVITSTAQPTNSMNTIAIIHTPFIQNQPNTIENQTMPKNYILTNISGVDLNKNRNENCVLNTPNITQSDKNNIAHVDDHRWQNCIVNDGHVDEKQLVDCGISETFTEPINVKTSVASSHLVGMDDANEKIISKSQNMNTIGTEMALNGQITQPSYSQSENPMENYQSNEFGDYGSREYHTQPPNESHFKNKVASGTNNNNNHMNITNVDTALSALFTRRLKERRHSSLDSGIPSKVCDDNILLPKTGIATNNVRQRRYSIASNLHNLPQNFGSLEPFYLSGASGAERTQNANFNSEEIEQKEQQTEKIKLYHQYQDDKDGYLNTFTTSLDARQIIMEPTSTLNSTQNAYLWQNDEIIKSNDQRSSVRTTETESGPSLNMINSSAFTSDNDDDGATNPNQTTNINQNNDYTVVPDNMQQSQLTTNQISDDQTFIENTMEQLKLANDIEDEQQLIDQFNPMKFGDVNEKIRVSTSHSKTVTWADDPHNNYKKDDAKQQFYDSANDDDNNNQNNINNSSSKHIYTDDPNQLQQYQQNEYLTQPQYQTTDPNNYVDAVETTSNPENPYDYQYDQNQNLYQSEVDASDQILYENQEYYYTDSDQYGIVQQMEPDQQGLQHAFYEQSPSEYTADTITNDGNTMISATEQLSDGYQQYPIDTMSQPQQDAYYSVTPGENYYTEYTDDNQSQQYYLEENADQKQQQQQQTPQQQQQPQQQINNTTNAVQANDERIPNYLQSDTDDSQITDGNQNVSHQDSDFDFSTNS